MGQAKVVNAYCYELNKVVNTEQARAAFFSNDNTEYDKFNFYCFCCGVKYKTRNILTKQRIDLTKHNTPHFAMYKKGAKHTDPLCEHLNDIPKEIKPSKGSIPITAKEFYHSHFLTTPIQSGIIHGLGEAPDMMEKEIVQKASAETIEYNVEQTSIFEDIVTNYLKLKQLNQTNDHKLKIDDSFEQKTTYENIFLEWKKIGYFYSFNKSENYFKYRIFYGKIRNKYLKDNSEDWNFIIDFDEDYFEINNIKVISRVIFPIELLNNNEPTKKFFDKQRENNYALDRCYIISTVPQLIEIDNSSSNGTHHEAHFVISDLNHIVLTFQKPNS